MMTKKHIILCDQCKTQADVDQSPKWIALYLDQNHQTEETSLCSIECAKNYFEEAWRNERLSRA